MNYYDEKRTKCVFWCDNCSIHNSMMTLVRNTNHVVVFNSAYSPELNPIENIFGIWKRKAEKDIREWDSLQDFIEKISKSFSEIEEQAFRSTFERCRNEIWFKVEQREDL